MHTTLTRELETLFFIILASAIGLFAVFSLRNMHQYQPPRITTPLPAFLSMQMTPTPTPTLVPQVTTATTTWTSSDGVEKITMKTTTTAKISSTYSFTVTDATTNIDTPLLTQTLSPGSSMTIPFNAFSSDDSYLYLKEIENGQQQYFVFKASGKPFANGQSYYDVAPIFAAYTSTYTLSDVIGWASPTLLILTTKKADGTIGPSYWVDVTTREIIPLATVFQ